MKKILGTLIAIQTIIMLLITPVSAATPVSSISGPLTVRAGDTISVKVNMNGSSLSAVKGEIIYNATQLTYTGNAGSLAGWTIDVDGGTVGKVKFLGIDDKLTAPIKSNKQLFILSFQVKTSVVAGAKIRIATEKLSVSDGISDFTPTNASYSVTVAAPQSKNAFLSTLKINNASISPAFSKDIISYSTSVPFAVSKLEVAATAEDTKAKVAVSGRSLAVGTSTVSIVVTAENGNKKIYSINVTRKQDPEYKAASNAALKSITPSVGILSPVFDTEKTLYYVYLPFEITLFDATGETLDPKAKGVEKAGIKINVGENEFIITGVAEDGTRKDYKIIVIRMPALGEEMPDPKPTTATSENNVSKESDGVTLSGTIVDKKGKPMVNKTVELHSEIKTTTTDANGFYKFENVTEGNHTVFIKEKDGTEIANILFAFTKSDKTKYSPGSLTYEGDTKFDLAIKDTEVEVLNIMKIVSAGIDSGTTSPGLPWWGIVLIAVAAAVVGFASSRMINMVNENGKIKNTKKV